MSGPSLGLETSRSSSVCVKQVKDELICSICLDFLREPILLSCAHSYCRSCLDDLIRTCDTETSAVHCPNCRAVTNVPNNDMDSLRTNFKLKSLVDIVSQSDKQQSSEVILQQSEMQVDSRQLPLCSQHCLPQEYYCRDCSELLCRRCMMDQHRHHNYEEADAVLSEHLAALQSFVQPAREALMKAEDTVGTIAQRKETVSANAASVKANITAFFDRARELLNEREQILLGNVVQHTATSVNRLGGLADTVQGDRISILAIIKRIERSENSRDVSVLTEFKAVAERLITLRHSILSTFESISSQEQPLVFAEDQSLCVPITKLGTLMVGMEHANIHPAADSPSMKAVTSTSDRNRHPLTPGPMLQTGAVHQVDGTLPRGTDYETGQPKPNTMSTCYRDPTYGAAKVDEKSYEVTKEMATTQKVVKCMHRQSLPIFPSIQQACKPQQLSKSLSMQYFTATKKPEMVIMCSKGHAHDDIHPCGIAVGHSDSIFVSDVRSHLVKVLASNGKAIDTFGGKGKHSGQFRAPCALAIDREQNIFILERENRRIQKFSNGTFTTIGQKGSKLGDPWGIAVTDERIFVTDWQKNCVYILDRNGKHLGCIASDSIMLKLPAGIAVTSEGHLLVADQENHCIWMITQDGRIIRQIGYKGDKPGQLNSPYGIAIDTNGLVIVTESGNSRVSVFSQQGEFLMCFGGRGSEEGRFNQPRHVSVNSKGQIVVADEMNQRIQIFEL